MSNNADTMTPVPTRPELLPCPFCQCTEILIVVLDDEDCCECTQCGGCGPTVFRDPLRAAEYWNTRAGGKP